MKRNSAMIDHYPISNIAGASFRSMAALPSTLPVEKTSAGVRVMSVTSGKGGVGKSNVVVNLAVALAQQGERVLVMDADIGLGNIDVLLGIRPTRNLDEVFSGKRRLSEVIIDGPAGIRLIPAGSGGRTLGALSQKERLQLMDELDSLEEEFDTLLIDTESGISENVTYFNVAAQEILLVLSPEPTSLTDVYSLIKVLATRHGVRCFNVLVNMARDNSEGLEMFKRLSQVTSKFLEVSLDYFGCIVHDQQLVDAVRRQKAVTDLYPRSAASRCFATIARTVKSLPSSQPLKGNIQFLFKRHYEAVSHLRCP